MGHGPGGLVKPAGSARGRWQHAASALTEADTPEAVALAVAPEDHFVAVLEEQTENPYADELRSEAKRALKSIPGN